MPVAWALYPEEKDALWAGVCCIPARHGAQHAAAPSRVWSLRDEKPAKVRMKRGKLNALSSAWLVVVDGWECTGERGLSVGS